MQAFHNKEEVRTTYLERVRLHRKMDEIVKGKYWEGGKGCAVGCTVHSDNHAAFETELGIPEWLARLEDTLFENLPNEKAKEWPVQFLEAVNLGSDLETIKEPFLIFILEQNLITLKSLVVSDQFPDIQKAITDTISATEQMLEAKKNKDESAAGSAESAARSAARSAESAARSAESAARSAARSAAESAAWSAESAAWSAARSAARSAASAAWSAAESAAGSAARSAARSAASAAGSAESAAGSAESAARSAAWSAAWSAAYEKYAEKLLELMRDCK